MSMENAKKFYEKVSTDKALQQQIGQLAKEDPKQLGSAIINAAKENGFEFTEDEMKAFMMEKAKQVKSGQELSDSELEAVAGGGKEHWIIESIASIGTACAASAASNKLFGGCSLDEKGCTGPY